MLSQAGLSRPSPQEPPGHGGRPNPPGRLPGVFDPRARAPQGVAGLVHWRSQWHPTDCRFAARPGHWRSQWHPNHAPRIMKLIVGCGYLGRRVARRWLDAGQEVAGVVRHAEQADHSRARGPSVDSRRRNPPGNARPSAPGGNRSGLHRIRSDRRKVAVGTLSGWAASGPGCPDAGKPASDFHKFHRRVWRGRGQLGSRRTPPADRPPRLARALLAAEEVLAAHPLGQRRIVCVLQGSDGPGRLPPTADLLAGRPLAVPPGCPVHPRGRCCDRCFWPLRFTASPREPMSCRMAVR